MKISDNVHLDEPEPEISFDGCHHGDEIMGAEVLIVLMRELCVNYGSDPQINRLVNSREIWIYPFINPDGRMAMTRYNNAGVDLNRDWGYMWDAWGGSPAPFSQPETRAARNWINDHQFVISQTNHGGTESISYPWSYRPNQCPDYYPIDFLAAGYSAISGYVPTLPYFQGYSGMYAINGSAKDAFYGLMGSVGWTQEVSMIKAPSNTYIPQYYNWNRPAMLYLTEMAGKGMSGMITDAVSGTPVPAIIWISDATRDYWPVYADPQVGDFHKFLLPGTYNLTVSANGYQSATAPGIAVLDTGATVVNFQLQPQTGTYAYRVVYSQIPDNNQSDEGYTPAGLGSPDNVNYSLGRSGYIVLDMGEPIADFPGNDFRVIEGDASAEGYTVKVSLNWTGPWTTLGPGTGTRDFDLSGSGLNEFRYIRLEDDGDGPAVAADAGFDLDAVEGRLIPASGPFVMATQYTIWDSTSNSNHTLEAGETARLYLNLQNLGVDPAQNVAVSVVSSSGLLTVSGDTLPAGNIPAGDLAGAGPFTVSADVGTPHNSRLSIQVTIQAEGGHRWSHSMQISVMQGAKLFAAASHISFPNTFLQNISDWPLQIRNDGMDSLNISQFTTTTPQFWVVEPMLRLAPGAQQTIHVQFMPDDTLNYHDTLTIHSNDPVNFHHTLTLEGTGMLAPSIQVTPDSLSVQLLPSDSIEIPLTISNTGPGELMFTAQIGSYNPGGDYSEGAGGNDSFGHIWIDSDEPGGPVYDWVELAGGAGTQIPISGPNVTSNQLPLGFTVSFYGQDYSSLRVCSNGWTSFNTFSVSYNNTALPSTLAPRAMVAPLWDNLIMRPDSKIYYLSESGRYIVQWENMYTVTGFGPYTFQLIIFNNGNLVLQYRDLTGIEHGYTVGMQNQDASDGFHIAYNEPYLHDQMAILIARRSWLSISPVGGTVAAGAQLNMLVRLKTSDFPPGDFWAAVEIFSNDPQNSQRVIPVHLRVDSVLTNLGEEDQLPKKFVLLQNYPNPFNPTTRISYQLAADSRVHLTIYDLIGREITVLVNEVQSPGHYSVNWNGRDAGKQPVASGLYLYRLTAGEFTATRKMILMR